MTRSAKRWLSPSRGSRSSPSPGVRSPSPPRSQGRSRPGAGQPPSLCRAAMSIPTFSPRLLPGRPATSVLAKGNCPSLAPHARAAFRRGIDPHRILNDIRSGSAGMGGAAYRRVKIGCASATGRPGQSPKECSMRHLPWSLIGTFTGNSFGLPDALAIAACGNLFPITCAPNQDNWTFSFPADTRAANCAGSRSITSSRRVSSWDFAAIPACCSITHA